MSSNLDPYKLVGATLHDRYSIEGFVGLGRFSAVYRGAEVESLRPVAIRVLGVRSTLLRSQRPLVLEHLRELVAPVCGVARECSTFADVLDVGALVGGEDQWVPAVVQLLAEGERRSSICRTLQIVLAEERARRPPPRALANALDWMTPVADALTYAHACGLVHGSVAPQAIVVRREAPVQLLDLGMVAAFAVVQAKDRAFASAEDIAPFFFEPAYASPEHFAWARGAAGEPTSAADVFSLALVLLELLTGRAPLGEGDDARLEAAACDASLRPTPRARGRDLGSYVETVFERALAVRPEDRHASVESFWSALRAASRLTLRPSRPSIPPPIAAPAVAPLLPLPSTIPTLAEAFVARAPRKSVPAPSEVAPAMARRSGSIPPSDIDAPRSRSSAHQASSRGARPGVEDDGANELVVGETIAGKYAIEQLLGRGGMGTVWRCMHLGLGERVAVKVMSRKMADNPEVRARFEREARAAAKIKSRYVARVYDTGTLPDGRPYIVMEYMEGETLADAMKGGETISLADAVRILGQVGRGLARAHELGIVHRDVKPENVFLAHTSDDGIVAKVFDFGIVKVPDAANDGSTRVGVLVGTPHYMSPEQADGLPIDERSDIFSLGVVAYRIFTGKRLFHGESIMQILMQICTAPLPSLLEHAPSLPFEVEAWFQRTCARDREDRFDNVIECVEALAAAAGVDVSRDVSILPPPPSPRLTQERGVLELVTDTPSAEVSCPTLIDEDPRALEPGAIANQFDSGPHQHAGFGVERAVEPSSVPPTALDSSGAPRTVSRRPARRGRFRRALTFLGFVAVLTMCAAAATQVFTQSTQVVSDGEMNAAAASPLDIHRTAPTPPMTEPPLTTASPTAALAAPSAPDLSLVQDASATAAHPPQPPVRAGRTRRAAATAR